MKEISAFIDQKKDEFSRLPFFEYLQDSRISPRQRLAFAPCAAPFIMSFGELNKSIFRDEPSSDPIQMIINKHTYEDDHHWVWFLEDLAKLGFDSTNAFTSSLKFLWGEETKASRKVAYELYRHSINANPAQKLVAIESVEATGNAFLKFSSGVIRELQQISTSQINTSQISTPQISTSQINASRISTSQKEYRFFGPSHLIVDTGHTYTSSSAKQIVESIELSEAARQESFELVNHIFSVFTDFVAELLAYAKAHRFDQEVDASAHSDTQNLKPIGRYLLEAGLVSSNQLQDALLQQQLTYMPIGKILSSQGYVNQETIEYLIEKVVVPERKRSNLNKNEPARLESEGKRLVSST